MGSELKRKNVPPASSQARKRNIRQRTATKPFEQCVNPASPTPPPTTRRPQRSPEPLSHRNRNALSPLFEPETPSQHATISVEDEDEEKPVDATADDDDGPVQYALEAATAEEEPAERSPCVAAAAAPAAQSSQPQRSESRAGAIDEEPHLHWDYRAWWTFLGKDLIASATSSRRNKPLYTVGEDKVWRWAADSAESQKPWEAMVDSSTATLYYTSGRQATGQCVVIGNRFGFEDELAEMDEQNGQIITCDFDLVLKELQSVRPAASQSTRGAVRGLVLLQQLCKMVLPTSLHERCATGSAVCIRDYCRCVDSGCVNSLMIC